MSKIRVQPVWRRAGQFAAAACLFGLVSGCSSVSHVIADAWPRALGGLPEGVPPRPDTAPGYMPVHDLPPPRENKPITAEERKQIESEITTNRGENTSQAEELKTQAPQRLPPVH